MTSPMQIQQAASHVSVALPLLCCIHRSCHLVIYCNGESRLSTILQLKYFVKTCSSASWSTAGSQHLAASRKRDLLVGTLF